MEHSRYWVGLDVGETQTSICVFGDDELPLLERAVPSDAITISQSLATFPASQIADMVMESGADRGLALQLRDFGFPLSVVDAGKAHRFLSIRYNKTDINDARGLADIARLGRASQLAIHIRSSECQTLRDELIVRRQLVRQRTAILCSLRSLLRNGGSRIKALPLNKQLRSKVEAETATILALGSEGAAERMLPMLRICEELTAYIVEADRRIAKFAQTNPVTRRLMQVPGVGPICAVSFYSIIEDPHRFPRSTDVGAYLGMVPKLRQSGTSLHHARITRTGNAMTRSHLFLAAGVMLSRSVEQCAIRDWGTALRARVGYRKARLAVARKLAIAMLSIWKNDCDFVPYPKGLNFPEGTANLVSALNRRETSMDHMVEPGPPNLFD